MTTKKRCIKCRVPKLLSDFHKNASHPDGHKYTCKECAAKVWSKWRKDNPEQNTIQKRNWRNANPDRARIVQAANQANAKAKRLGVPGKLRPDELQNLFKLYGNKCLRCDGRPTVDHVNSFLNEDGTVNKLCTNTVDNVQPLCKGHNSEKGINDTDYRTRRRKAA